MDIIQTIKKVAPRAKPEYIQALQQGGALFKQASINTKLRYAHFLAQILHESGGLTVTFENMNYRAPRIMEIFGVGRHSAAVTKAEAKSLAGHPYELAERVYGIGNPRKAKELGNIKAGDGYKYRGGGILQTTGGSSYKIFGDKCGVDFYNHPEFVCTAEHALKPAIYEWIAKGCNAAADKNDIGSVTRKINGGTNGLSDRKAWFNKIWPLLDNDPAPAWAKAKSDVKVAQLQKNLIDLGVATPDLEADGKLGPETEQSVKNFQSKNKLGVDGDLGPVTVASIDQKLNTVRNDKDEVETSFWKSPMSKTTMVGGGLASLQVGSEITSQVSSIKSNLDSLDIWDMVGKFLHSPLFLMSVVILALFGYIIYQRYKLHRNKGV